MNQSVIDRMNLVVDVELPSIDTMIERAMSITGAKDEHRVAQMVEIVRQIDEYCKKNSISDGMVGMRSLIDWIDSADITGSVYQSALYTVVSKATTDEEERAAIVSSILEPIFLPGM